MIECVIGVGTAMDVAGAVGEILDEVAVGGLTVAVGGAEVILGVTTVFAKAG
jgi:hypothetical protein